MHPIKFKLKYEPNNLAQIAKWPLKFGLVLLAISFILFAFYMTILIEFEDFYDFEFIWDVIKHLFLLGVFSRLVALTLEAISWRRGSLSLKEDTIEIVGGIPVTIPVDSIVKIISINSKRKIIHIDTTCYNLRIKFRLRQDYGIAKTFINKKFVPQQ